MHIVIIYPVQKHAAATLGWNTFPTVWCSNLNYVSQISSLQQTLSQPVLPVSQSDSWRTIGRLAATATSAHKVTPRSCFGKEPVHSQSTTAKETSLSVEKHRFLFQRPVRSYSTDIYVDFPFNMQVQYWTALDRRYERTSHCNVKLVFRSKPFCTYYTDLCSQSLWRQSNGDVTVNILIHQTTTCTNMDNADWKASRLLKSFHTALEPRQPSNQWVPVALAGVKGRREVKLTSN